MLAVRFKSHEIKSLRKLSVALRVPVSTIIRTALGFQTTDRARRRKVAR
jgi:hypothetical protein